MEPSPLEENATDPNTPLKGEHSPLCEGEPEDGTCSATPENRLENRPENPRKQKAENNRDPRKHRRIRGIRIDYKYLNNQFPAKEEANIPSAAKRESLHRDPR